jgi:crotonobetainyl-CoA:carnitine CoA-transferase CaiB-like acyl-CoA transferase
VQVADLAGGMLAAVAVLGALLGRERTGEGAYLDVSMLDAVVSWIAPLAGAFYLQSGQNPPRGATQLTGALPCYNVYATADGTYLTLSALEPHFWTAFCQATGHEDWLRRQFDAMLIPEVAALFGQHTRTEWLAQFGEADVCVEPVNGVDEVLRHPQVRHRGLVVDDTGPAGAGQTPVFGSPFRFVQFGEGRAPALGEHTYQVLHDAGLSPVEIQDLADARIVRLSPPP